MNNIEFLHEYTEDGIKLQGVHWSALNKETCIVCIHGMTGNIIDNYFGEVLGEQLSKIGYGFIFGHNRGHSHISDFMKKDGSFVRIGAAYEIFEECLYDIDLWINKARALGYKNIILMGHSIGANKVIYYLASCNDPTIKAAVLASPSDMVGDLKSDMDSYNSLLKEAKEFTKLGHPEQLLSQLLDNWFFISANTFLNTCVENTNADNLPILRNPDKFEQLSKIDIPILVLYGSKENSDVNGISNRLNIIKEKAINCPKCITSIIDGADHPYHDKEEELAKLIINYIKEVKND